MEGNSFATVKSGLPSPSRSEIAITVGSVPVPVAKSIFESKEKEPGVLVFLNIDIVYAVPVLPTAKSGLPSPSKSPTDTQRGAVPVPNSVLFLVKAILPTPELVFFNIVTVLAPWLAETISSFPSPSKSATATYTGPPPTV